MLNNNSTTTNSDAKGFEALDVLSIMGFAAQMNNISKNKKQTEYIQKVIKAIAEEIEKLHKENDIIIKKTEEILELLNK